MGRSRVLKRTARVVSSVVFLCSRIVLLLISPTAMAGSAPSPWPVLHSDPANRDFVPLAGPRVVVPKWSALQVRAISAAVLVGPEGNLYTVTMDAGDCHLFALNPNGEILWCSDQVRAAYAAATVNQEGSIFVTDGIEVFRFEATGALSWRVPATRSALAGVLMNDGYLLIVDSLGLATAYDAETGAEIAQIQLPSGVIPRPKPLPEFVSSVTAGAPEIGIHPQLVETFVDAFLDFNTAVGNNIPAIHPETGRIFITVSANKSGSEGVFYGLEFEPAADGASGKLSIACAVPVGLASATSPAISATGERVYAGDSRGFLTAFKTDDCSIAWTLALDNPSLASPTVGPNGEFFMLVNGKVMAFRDNGNNAEILWRQDAALMAQARGMDSGRFNSVVAHASNYLYIAASFFRRSGGFDIPMVHALVTIDPETGEIVSATDLGEESNSVVSLGPNGMIYVASKPLAKARLLGYGLEQSVPPPLSGVFAYEPASYRDLVTEGAQNMIAHIQLALDKLDRDRSAFYAVIERATTQATAVRNSLELAQAHGEVSKLCRAAGSLEESEALLKAAREEPEERSLKLASTAMRRAVSELESCDVIPVLPGD